MNKIYRRLWSTARQCWVVASELSAAKGKASQLIGTGTFAVALMLSSAAASAAEEGAADEELEGPALQEWALRAAFDGRAAAAPPTGVLTQKIYYQNANTTDQLYRDSTLSGDLLVQLGSRSSLVGNRSVGYGSLVNSRGDNNTAIGHGVQISNGGYATSVGAESMANGLGTTALGNRAKAYTENSIAVGSGAATDSGAGISKIAIGGDASAGTGGWTGAIALGGRSRAQYDGVAIGYEASTSANGTVALGRGSVASEANTVSVGKAGGERRIVNVADGNVNATSTDVVNGRQLNAVRADARSALTTANTAKTTADRALAASGLVSQTSASSAIRVGGDNTGTVLDVRNRSGANRKISGVADAALSATSTEAVTGKQLHATNQTISTVTSTANAAKAAADAAAARIAAGALALGQSALAEGSGGTASAALGSAAKAYNSNGVALGADARAGVNDKGERSTGNGAVAIGALSRSGNGAVATGLRASAIGDRAVALGNDANAAATHATATGYKATASASQATAIGREASASGTFSTALGNLASARAESALALGDRAVASHTGSVALGNGSQTTAGNQISVGNGTLKRKIVNVADGALNTSSAEAVTGKQLNATNVEVATVRTTAASAQTAAGAAKTAADDALAKANALGGLVSQTSATGNVRLGGENTGTVLDVRNKSNASRKLTGVADATLSTSSTEAVSGKQLNATNVEVASVRTTATSAQTTANAARTAADSALGQVDVLGGLVSQVSATGNVRLGGENTGTVLDVRNKSNASRKLTGVADATLSTSSTEAVSGKQLNTTNVEVASVRTTATSAQTTANAAKTTADNALGKADVLGGLVSQVSATGNVRLGGENTGTVLDVRNKSNANRKLTGVADATLSTSSTEVVTGRQLFGVDQKVTANQSLLASHATELARHETRIADNRRDLDDLRTEFDNFDPDLEGVVRYAADGSIDMDGGKVRGVAAGDISSAGSTDAVNGGQLFATNQRVDAMEAKSALIEFGREPGQEAAEAGNYGVAIGNGAQASMASEGGTAIGSYSSALAMNSVALGRGAIVQATATAGFALGAGADIEESFGVGLGAYAKVRAGAEGSVALGAYSEALEKDVVSIGNLTTKRRLVNVGRGTADTDATTVTQLGESLASLGGGAGIDVNGVVVAPTYRMQGATQGTVEDALNILDGAVITTGTRVDQVENQLRSVFQDSPGTRSDGLNQLTFAGANGMVLSNVANGAIAAGSRDAVNGGQLHSLQQQLNGRVDGLEQRIDGQPQSRALSVASVEAPSATPAHSPVADESVTPPVADTPVADTGAAPPVAPQANSPKAESPTPQVDTAELEKMLARANEYTDGAISNFERRLDKMDKRFNRMAAMNSAQTAMAMNTAGLATYNRLGAGVGYAEGESAMAVGYQRVLNEKGSATFSLNGAFTNSGERSMGVGVGIGW